MIKEGADEKWTDIACKRKWAEIAPEDGDGLAADQPSPGIEEFEEQHAPPMLGRNYSYPGPNFAPFAPPPYHYPNNFRTVPERKDSPLSRIREDHVEVGNRQEQQLFARAENLVQQFDETQRP